MRAQFILASGSARRRALLDQMRLSYRTVRADVDESMRDGETAADYVLRVAAKKARWAVGHDASALPVLAADTAVVLDAKILGKPGDAASARHMLQQLSGRTHEVYSAVVLLARSGRECSRLSVSEVTFAHLDAEWIEACCACGEPLDKAGAYAIQGYAAQYISRLEGSYSGVMGLPLYETMELLRHAGVATLPGINAK
jgi:septum formation protein